MVKNIGDERLMEVYKNRYSGCMDRNRLSYNIVLLKWYMSKGILPRKRNISILELGCGKCYITTALRILGFKDVTGVDQYKFQDDVVIADINKKLPFAEGSFDVVISRDTVEHIKDSDRYFSEARRVLKVGGKLITHTVNVNTLSFGNFYDDYTHHRPFNPSSLGFAYQYHKFNRIKVLNLRGIPYIWRYTKKLFNAHWLFSKKIMMVGVGTK